MVKMLLIVMTLGLFAVGMTGCRASAGIDAASPSHVIR